MIIFYQIIKAKEFDGIKIIRYESSIYYANVEYFTYKILKLSELNVDETLVKIKKARAEYENYVKQSNPIVNQNFLFKFLKKSTRKDTKTNENDHEINSSDVGERKPSNVNIFSFLISKLCLFYLS